MNFCSPDFIFLFLPLLVLLHGVTKGKLRNAVLFFGSVVFYALASGSFYEWILLLLIAAVMNYLFGLIITETEGRYRKTAFITGVVFNIAFLAAYRFSGAFVSSLLPPMLAKIGVTGVSFSDIVLPLGLSFYTLKNLSYLREVYDFTVESEISFINYGAYLTMFPQISMGPIQTYKDFKPYLDSRTVTFDGISSGAAEFIIGFGMKKILADSLAVVWDGITGIGFGSVSTPLAWMGIISFALRLYFDFYGYSLMASGIGQMLGYITPQNFDYPYTARSVNDFFRRWHMTLCQWFRENVYFPLGGSRCSRMKLTRNLFVVWLIAVLWHGNTPNFLVCGLFLFLLALLEKKGILDFITENRVLSRIYMFFVVIFTWLFFALPTLSDVGVYLSRMFGFFGKTPEGVAALDWLKYAGSAGVFMILGLLFITPLPARIYEKIKNKPYIAVPLLLAVFWYSVYLAVCGADVPFMYIRF